MSAVFKANTEGGPSFFGFSTQFAQLCAAELGKLLHQLFIFFDMQIPLPEVGTYPPFYANYVAKVPNDGQLLDHLEHLMAETAALLTPLTDAQLCFRYAEDKWSIKEMLVHIMDAERVFTYRALRFARRDATDLPGFDENAYVPHSEADSRSFESIWSEFQTLRASTVAFIRSLTDQMLAQQGTIGGREMSVLALVNILYGHHRHHLDVLQARYWPVLPSV